MTAWAPLQICRKYFLLTSETLPEKIRKCPCFPSFSRRRALRLSFREKWREEWGRGGGRRAGRRRGCGIRKGKEGEGSWENEGQGGGGEVGDWRAGMGRGGRSRGGEEGKEIMGGRNEMRGGREWNEGREGMKWEEGGNGGRGEKSVGATICIGWEILCLPYAGF